MNLRMWAATAFVAAGAAAVPAAQGSNKGMLLVLSKGETTLSLVDPETREVVGRVPSGPDPHEVVATADGRTAYVSNYGGGAYNTLTVVDLVKRAAVPSVDLGALRGPHGLEAAGGKIWFTAEAAKVFGRYDPASRQIDLVQGSGQNGTHMILVTRDQMRVLTTNVGSATLSIFDAAPAGRGRGGPPPGPPAPGGAPPRGGPPPPGPPSGGGGAPRLNWTQTVVPVGAGAEGFDLSPDQREVWVANAQDGTISVVDLASKSVSATIDANVRGANRLKFTPDGRTVLVSTLSGPAVAVFDAASRKETKRIEVGTGAAGLQVQPDGARAYVACTPDDYVAVIDLQTLTVTGRIDAGRQPDGLAWAAAR